MITGIFGDLGSGKTLFMVIMVYEYYVPNKYQVYANFDIVKPEHIGTKNYFPKLTPEQLLDISTLPKGKKVILVDEIYAMGFDSRVSSSKINRFLTYLFFQSRKVDADILYTAQLNSSVDKRVRSLTDNIVLASKSENAFHYQINNLRRMVRFQYAEKYFKAYDTKEIIHPIYPVDPKKIFK